MKKIISIISSLAMLATLAPVSFAAKHPDTKVDADPEVQIEWAVSAATLKKTSAATMTLSVTINSDITLGTDVTVTNQDEIDEAEANEEEAPEPEYEINSATGVNALQVYYKFADGVVVDETATNTNSFKAYDKSTKKLGGAVSLKSSLLSLALFASGADSIATANPVAKVKVTLTDAFYTSLGSSATATAATLKAALQAKLEDGTLGAPTKLEDSVVSFQGYEDGSKVMQTEVGSDTKPDDYDYFIAGVIPTVAAGPVVPAYKTENGDEIMETKAGTYAAEPEDGDTGKGLYWLINFAQGATHQYISADIQRFDSSEKLLKQQSILIKLDDSNKFVGAGERAAYIFMENVPAGKYKGAFYISATGKPEDRSPLFADSDFIEVK